MALSCIMGMVNVAAQDESETRIRGVLEEIRSLEKPHSAVVLGKKILIHREVFSPAYFPESKWFAEVIPPIVGERDALKAGTRTSFLDVGTGTGIVALFTALNGVEVTMTEINPAGVRCAQSNFKKYKLDGKVHRCDVYDALPMGARYDFIFWNHPFCRGNNPNEDLLSRSVFDYHYQGLERYVQYAHLRLAQPHGRLLLGTGGPALLPENFSEIERIAAKNDYRMELLRETKTPLVAGSSIMSRLAVYEFCKANQCIGPR